MIIDRAWMLPTEKKPSSLRPKHQWCSSQSLQDTFPTFSAWQAVWDLDLAILYQSSRGAAAGPGQTAAAAAAGHLLPRLRRVQPSASRPAAAAAARQG